MPKIKNIINQIFKWNISPKTAKMSPPYRGNIPAPMRKNMPSLRFNFSLTQQTQQTLWQFVGL